MHVNWLYVALAAFAVYAAILGYFIAKRRWTLAGLGVAAANMMFVLVNLVAPFRGLMDPDYAGYSLGLLHAEPGIMVTLIAGSIVDLALLGLIGIPMLLEALSAPSEFSIQLGEYLAIPGLVAVGIAALLLMAPLVGSAIWSARRIRVGSAG
jgi:hypothetical protein